ncbi:hypothetical protein FBU59_001743 [Linderina macrospora]|uniref:Uncharacterized protein n=1 Tax=Linderina macrospora TaxID=4868 RepID=A0ACC1JD48_9FUNG|nr:hypothetical protein FBU59_001743 [Linderina macrospora]
MPETVTIIGATGIQGGSVLASLYDSPDKYRLRGVTRNIDSDRVKELRAQFPSVEWVSADNSDPESLCQAFKDTDIVFANTNYISPEILAQIDAGDLDAEFKQGKNIVDAAIAVGVKHIVYSSLESPSKGSNGKHANVYELEGKNKIEQYVRSQSDKIKGYFVYAGFYYQNLVVSATWTTTINSDGVEVPTVRFSFPLPEDAKVPHVDIERDLGNAVRLIVDNREEYEGKIVAAVGEVCTPGEITEAYTRITGVPAVYVNDKFPDFDRPEIYAMMDYFVEFGGYNVPNVVGGRDVSPRPFVTVDQFWKNHSDFRPPQ